jgi:maltose/maltodextrin transport system permease protein
MLSRAVTAVAAILALFIVYELYVGGSPLLAAAVGGGLALAFFVYTARGTSAARYLFPGLAGIALFIVLPLVYTVWIGFTNYSSRNLLTYERATDVLLGELVQSDARYQFTLHADGSGFRIVLRTGDEEATAASAESGIILDDSAGSGSSTGSDSAGPAPTDTGSAATPPPARPAAPTVFVTNVVPLTSTAEQRVPVLPLAGSGFTPGEPLPLKDVIARRDAIRATTVQFPDGSSATMASLREFTPQQPLYRRNADGSLTNQKTGERLTPNSHTGYYETPGGGHVLPGFRTYVGLDNYVRAFTDEKFRGPFFRVFLWTIVFAGLTVFACTTLGLFLAELLSWEGLRFPGVFRVLLFLPYAVPGFISILVFKGLFNRNFGEINLILEAVLGIRPNWTGNAFLARFMILIVNTWL